MKERSRSKRMENAERTERANGLSDLYTDSVKDRLQPHEMERILKPWETTGDLLLTSPIP